MTTPTTATGTTPGAAPPVPPAGARSRRRAAPGRRVAPPTTASAGTRVLGALALVGIAFLLLFGLVWSPPDALQGDAARLMYIHVPAAMWMYVAFIVTAIGSVAYLWKRSQFWDLLAAASAEIGVVLTALVLATGMIWGRPTWGVYWVWDARLTSTALLLLLFLGYLAVRRLPADPHVRSKRAAIVALIAIIDVPIVHYSVDWWRSLHQPATLNRLDPTIGGLMLFSLVLGIVVFGLIYLWLVTHRFRLEYLREQVARLELEQAIASRRDATTPVAVPSPASPAPTPPAAPGGAT